MAITKLLRIKESRTGSNPSAGLRRCIQYILNPEKTDGGTLVIGNAGTNADFIYEEMAANKESWGKKDGSQGFHYVISFSPDEEVSPVLALQIGNEFCKELLQDNHIYVVASHTDTEHAHCHIVFDSVSFRTGQKFHSGGYDWLARIQPITDSICEKYGLSTLSFDMEKERKSQYHKEWEDEKEKRGNGIKSNPSWQDVIKDDIEECISQAGSWGDFLLRLKEMHYEYHDGKYLSLRPFGREKFIRTVRLGHGYSKEELAARLGMPGRTIPTEGRDYKAYGDAVPLLRSSSLYIKRGQSITQQQRYFYKKYFRISHLRKPSFHSSWKYKKEIAKLGALSAQASYLFDHDITGIADIERRLSELEAVRGREYSRERRLCKSILREYTQANNSEDITFADGGYDSPLPGKSAIYQVRLNQALYGEADFSAETFRARIPGTPEYIRLYSDDSREYNDGATISTYIYGEAQYQVEDADGNVIRLATGEAVKERFKYRALNQKEEKKEAEKGRANHG